MKKLPLIVATLLCSMSALAQPQLNKDNVEESKVKSWPVHKVMLPEKAVEEISVTR